MSLTAPKLQDGKMGKKKRKWKHILLDFFPLSKLHPYLFCIRFMSPFTHPSINGFQCINKAFQNVKCFTDFCLVEGRHLAHTRKVGLRSRCQIGQKTSRHGTYGWPLALLSPCHPVSTVIIKSISSSLARTWTKIPIHRRWRTNMYPQSWFLYRWR